MNEKTAKESRRRVRSDSKGAPPTASEITTGAIPSPPIPPAISPSPIIPLRISSHKLLNPTKHRIGVLKVLKEMVHMERDQLSDLQILGGIYLLNIEEKFINSKPGSAGTLNSISSGAELRQRPARTAPKENVVPTYYEMVNTLRRLVEKIITSHVAILYQMEGRFKAIKLGEYACFVSDIVLAIAESFKLYDSYPEASAALSFLIEENKSKKEFNEMLFILSQHPETRNQPLKYYLKRPLAFLDKFLLLGKVLLMYTTETEPDYPALISALEKMSFELKKVKRQILRQENKARMLTLNSLMQGMADKSILSGNRELIYEVSCWRMTDRGRNFKSSAWQKKSLHLFLFSDMILLTKKKKSQMIGPETYSYAASLSLSRTVFNILESADSKACFELREISLNDSKEDAFFTLSTDIPERRDMLLKMLSKTQFKLFTGYQHSVSETRKEKLKKVKVELAETKGKLAKEKHKNKLLKAKVFEYKKVKLAALLHAKSDMLHSAEPLKKRSASAGDKEGLGKLNASLPELPSLHGTTKDGQEIKEGEELRLFVPKVASPRLEVPKTRHKRAHSMGDSSDEHDHAALHNALMEKYGLEEFVKTEDKKHNNKNGKKEKKSKKEPAPLSSSPTKINASAPIAIVTTRPRKSSGGSKEGSPRKNPSPTSLPRNAQSRSDPKNLKDVANSSPPVNRLSQSDDKRKTRKKKAKSSKKEGNSKKKKKKETKEYSLDSPRKEASEGGGTMKQPRELMQRIGNIQKEKQGDDARSEVKYWLV